MNNELYGALKKKFSIKNSYDESIYDEDDKYMFNSKVRNCQISLYLAILDAEIISKKQFCEDINNIYEKQFKDLESIEKNYIRKDIANLIALEKNENITRERKRKYE